MDFKELMANASIVMNVILMLMTVTPVRIVSIHLVRLNVSVNRALSKGKTLPKTDPALTQTVWAKPNPETIQL